MALKDNASLALIPAAYKTSKIYSAIPTDGDGDFTFSRSGSATRINKAGLVETMGTNVGRLNYDLTNGTPASCPSLLLEPTRRNLFLNSEDFTNGSWIKTRTTITGNQTTAPNGTQSADLLTGNGAGTSYIYDGVFMYYANYYVSIFVKNINGNNFTIQNFTQSGTAVFNLTNGTVTSTSGTMSNAKIEQYANNWYRVSAKITSTLGGLNANIGYGVKNFNGDQFYIWGAQIEDNASGGSVSYTSSYIPTSGSAVTRTVDTCGTSDTNLINNTEGVLFVDFEFSEQGTTSIYQMPIGLYNSGGGGSQRITIDNYSGKLRIYIVSSGGTRAVWDASNSISNVVANQRYKIAIRYKDGDCASYVNGELYKANSGSVSGFDLVKMVFGYANFGNTLMHRGKIYQAMYFDTALTNAELQTLTS
jgi:hypothetical protein